MKTNRSKMLLSALLLAFTVSGCVVAPPLPDEWGSRVFISADLRDNLQIVSIRDEELPNGNRQILLSGQSLGYFTQRVRYRALWFNASGAPVNTVVSAWSVITLENARPLDLKLIGPGRHGVSYRVEFEKAP